MTIQESNKLIAEFMGYSIREYTFGDAIKGAMAYRLVKDEVIYDYLGLVNNRTIDQAWEKVTFKFHESWDWLMPVVRKIVVMCIHDEDPDKNLFHSEYYDSIIDTIPCADIESSYKVVVEFIKWYNESKTNQ